MKKLVLVLALVLGLGLTASAANPKDILSGLAGALGGSNKSDDSSSNSGLGALGDFINNTIANNNFTIEDLEGSWEYEKPAVSFESSNVLQNIGGVAAGTALENQLEPYYRRLGFNRTTLEVDSLHNFTIRLGLVQLRGTVEKDDSDHLVFNFNAFKRIPLGKVTANATKSGDTLNLTFDATKLINILNKVSGALNNTTLTTVTNLLNSYDGVYMGYKLKAKK